MTPSWWSKRSSTISKRGCRRTGLPIRPWRRCPGRSWLSAWCCPRFLCLVLLTWWTSSQLPTGYIPNQDQGRFYVAVQLPDATSTERTQRALDHMNRLLLDIKDKDIDPETGEPRSIVHTTEIAGMSFTFN